MRAPMELWELMLLAEVLGDEHVAEAHFHVAPSLTIQLVGGKAAQSACFLEGVFRVMPIPQRKVWRAFGAEAPRVHIQVELHVPPRKLFSCIRKNQVSVLVAPFIRRSYHRDVVDAYDSILTVGGIHGRGGWSTFHAIVCPKICVDAPLPKSFRSIEHRSECQWLRPVAGVEAKVHLVLGAFAHQHHLRVRRDHANLSAHLHIDWSDRCIAQRAKRALA
mmetsp:Transcript_9863/g.21884  ORF Transcript_9863/g.21884 Transcript_9863/m.21884 type:complete len:219 (+) Transcript_9863:1380-2036(+)